MSWLIVGVGKPSHYWWACAVRGAWLLMLGTENCEWTKNGKYSLGLEREGMGQWSKCDGVH